MRERLKQHSKEHDAAETEKTLSLSRVLGAGFWISHRLTKQWILLRMLDHFWSSPKIIVPGFSFGINRKLLPACKRRWAAVVGTGQRFLLIREQRMALNSQPLTGFGKSLVQQRWQRSVTCGTNGKLAVSLIVSTGCEELGLAYFDCYRYFTFTFFTFDRPPLSNHLVCSIIPHKSDIPSFTANCVIRNSPLKKEISV